jgi:hypothetical protein
MGWIGAHDSPGQLLHPYLYSSSKLTHLKSKPKATAHSVQPKSQSRGSEAQNIHRMTGFTNQVADFGELNSRSDPLKVVDVPIIPESGLE